MKDDKKRFVDVLIEKTKNGELKWEFDAKILSWVAFDKESHITVTRHKANIAAYDGNINSFVPYTVQLYMADREKPVFRVDTDEYQYISDLVKLVKESEKISSDRQALIRQGEEYAAFCRWMEERTK